MTDTNVAIVQHQQPAQRLTNRKTGKPLKVTGKLSEALDLMITEGLRYPEACVRVGLPKRTARKALDKPHVIAELRRRKQVFRADVSAANILRLAQIRDQDDNRMAALGAIKALEQIDEENEQRSAARSSPGVTIVIGGPSAPAASVRTIEAKPLIGKQSGHQVDVDNED